MTRLTAHIENTMLSLKQILSRKIGRDYKDNCGIYFLIKNEKIVYVGQSINIKGRVHQHIISKTKQMDFDSWAFEACDYSELDKKETDYIHFFKPKYNEYIKSPGKFRVPLTTYFQWLEAMDGALEGLLLQRFEIAFERSGFVSRTEFLRYIIINHCDDKGIV